MPGEHLRPHIEKAPQIIAADPQHHFDWHFRKDFYSEFGSLEDLTVRKARGWLAISAAQKVLPLCSPLLNETIDEVASVLDGAISLMNGPVDEETVNDLKNTGYYFLGLSMAHLKANLAAFTSYKALLEADGRLEPFKRATGYGKYDEFTDADWAIIAALGDTAGCAAIAFSCYEELQDSIEYDPDKLLLFWRW